MGEVFATMALIVACVYLGFVLAIGWVVKRIADRRRAPR
jgi:hypothetical protein